MNDDITTIMHVLQKEFPSRAIQHQFANNLHTFRLGSDSETQWLHVARELVEESGMKSSVYHLLNICSAADALLHRLNRNGCFLITPVFMKLMGVSLARRGIRVSFWRWHNEVLGPIVRWANVNSNFPSPSHKTWCQPVDMPPPPNTDEKLVSFPRTLIPIHTGICTTDQCVHIRTVRWI